mmetsp:Transcript_37015/g.116455  ORF Transcript_37015/g.116455 Transcript_37015/m.116455 type:complete len:88 (+) Transcript_37015:733-996(+)
MTGCCAKGHSMQEKQSEPRSAPLGQRREKSEVSVDGKAVHHDDDTANPCSCCSALEGVDPSTEQSALEVHPSAVGDSHLNRSPYTQP